MCRDGMWVASRFFVEMTIYRGGFIYISSSRAGEMKSWQIELRCDEKWISGWAPQRSFFCVQTTRIYEHCCIFSSEWNFTLHSDEKRGKKFPFFLLQFHYFQPTAPSHGPSAILCTAAVQRKKCESFYSLAQNENEQFCFLFDGSRELLSHNSSTFIN